MKLAMAAFETIFVALALLPTKLLAIVRMKSFAALDPTSQRRVADSAAQRLLISWITWMVAMFSMALGADDRNRIVVGTAGLGFMAAAVLVLSVYFGHTATKNLEVPHQFVAVPLVTRPWRQSALNTLILVGIIGDLCAVGLRFLAAFSHPEGSSADCARAAAMPDAAASASGASADHSGVR
jgi:hypothetical protein